MTSGTLGGMMGPIVEEAATTATANSSKRTNLAVVPPGAASRPTPLESASETVGRYIDHKSAPVRARSPAGIQ